MNDSKEIEKIKEYLKENDFEVNKSGVYTYESDIIKDGGGNILIVEYCNKRAKYISVYPNKYEGKTIIFGGIDSNDEVIGNIYQHKHLLK